MQTENSCNELATTPSEKLKSRKELNETAQKFPKPAPTLTFQAY